MFLRVSAGTAIFLWVLAGLSGADAAPASGPSGKPVPRYESLKYGEVNARLGPSLDHRVLWTYHRRGLPLQVIAESGVWRQVSDPDGDVSWINAAQLADQQTVFVAAAETLPLRRSPNEEARPVAILGHGVVGALEECRGGWRKVRVDGHSGWAPMASLWGAERCAAAPGS
jgi:SH3-like domain-containing protein